MTAPQADAGRRLRLWLGLAVVVLLLGHLLPVYVLGGGARGLDWNSMAARWSTGVGLVWDLALVWVAAGYAALLLDGRRRSGRSGVAFQSVCSALVVAIAVLTTVAAVTTDLSLS